MRIAQEEIFGPVMVIVRANDVFTESGGVARDVMERASPGMVGVKVGVPDDAMGPASLRSRNQLGLSGATRPTP